MRGWRRDERRDRRDGDGRRRHRDDHHRLHGRRVREGQSGRRGQQGRGRSAVEIMEGQRVMEVRVVVVTRGPVAWGTDRARTTGARARRGRCRTDGRRQESVGDARHGLERREVTRRRRGRGRRRGAARGRRARTDGAELGLLLDLTEAVQVVVDPGAGAVVEHAVVAQVGHRGQ